MEKKKCKYCNLEKNIEDFRKNRNKCKNCENNDCKKWYQQNKNTKLKYSKKYREENNFIIKNKLAEWRKKNPNYFEVYYSKNKNEIISKSVDYYKERMQNDFIFRFKNQIRKMIYNSFYRKKHNKNNKCENILGCSYKIFAEHLLKTFVDNYGYEWDGIEKIHIDHIVPLAKATTKEEIINLCHYTNLQLLKAKDNLSKSSKTN